MNFKPSIRPALHVEQQVVTSILDGTYPKGAVLPNERTLAEKIGVTRQTLREILQRLSREGWITIHHGKPTVVNDYWEKGGMGMLSTMSRYSEYLPNGFVLHLLEVRANLLPVIAGLSAKRAPEVILKYLSGAGKLEDKAEAFSVYDWDLQLLMASHAGNPVYRLILNDFSRMFESLGLKYFGLKKVRKISLHYYLELYDAIDRGGEDVEGMVFSTMEKSIEIWKKLK
ncbi:MAG: fatty acid metabolism transcriptional regulator FadR [Desulfobacterales bacterium]|nr:fatty acid metabolism transcriptional regulator FadR [Desulfobacterales bacterium]